MPAGGNEIAGAGAGTFVPGLQAGARNLVVGCAGIVPGQRVLIVSEDPALGWFDDAAPRATAEAARRAGAKVSVLPVGDPVHGSTPELDRAIRAADVAIFFARIGDQDRFLDHGGDTLRVVSYARTGSQLASPFGRADHGEMIRLKASVDRTLMDAARIEITCPLGTRLAGPGPAAEPEAPDVAVRRFPMCVPAPVSARGFSGEVVVAGYLTPTGSQVYDPPNLALPTPVVARVRDGRITGFRGAPETVRRVEAHYAAVAARFGIQADVVHSWHAGIHEECRFDGTVDANPDLWSNSIFGSPRYLHFHTCGDYPPGEICWMVASPTVTADRRAVWRDGVLNEEQLLVDR